MKFSTLHYTADRFVTSLTRWLTFYLPSNKYVPVNYTEEIIDVCNLDLSNRFKTALQNLGKNHNIINIRLARDPIVIQNKLLWKRGYDQPTWMRQSHKNFFPGTLHLVTIQNNLLNFLKKLYINKTRIISVNHLNMLAWPVFTFWTRYTKPIWESTWLSLHVKALC